jgi:SAM-dependent methyltransferase
MPVDDRKQREAAFHDDAYAAHGREHLWSSYYAIVGSSRQFYEDYLICRCEGADVLEYGSGLATTAFLLADKGAASVTGIDISPVAVKSNNERASIDGYARVSYQVMDAEALEFDADAFDLVCGTSIIHHLDLRQSYAELSRVLRDEGTGIFIEPLGHNPLINLYRRRTPSLRTPDEHPLLMKDLRLASEFFRRVRCRFVHLTSLAAVPFHRSSYFRGLVEELDQLDRRLFRAVPPLRRFAWQVVIELSGPKTQT